MTTSDTAWMALVSLLLACDGERATRGDELPLARASESESAPTTASEPRDAALARVRMVDDQIAARGVRDGRVLEAMRKVPRHEFVPERQRPFAYADSPLPIGHEQTISQPYIVARMTELLAPERTHKVLEIGTGSGYQAAVLSGLVREVYSIEIVEPLAQEATRVLARLGYHNVHVRAGDGYGGWPEQAPFDGIIVTAAPPRIPEPLKQQLRVGGRLVIPVGEGYQELRVLRRTEQGFAEESVLPVRFVPMTGEAERR
jgi:protein-L-isoaspartate(D-aspartate) O-methyltransferase